MGALRAGTLQTVGQSTAQVIDGSLKFDTNKKQYLTRTVTSTGNRRTFTYSCWIKLAYAGTEYYKHFGMSAHTDNPSVPRHTMWYTPYKTFGATQNPTGGSNDFTGAPGFYRDYSGWHHIVMAYDLTQGANANQLKIYINGVLQSNAGQTGAGSSPTYVSNQDTPYNTSGNAMNIGRYSASPDDASHWDGHMAQIYWIDGQQLDASYFGYTDPLTGTWRPKKFDVTKTPGGSYGTNGFYLPFDGSAPIGQDKSGRGNNWTPVNFGGSAALDKATGALPILNTDGGGKTARPGTRTDAYASNLVLAAPLVGNANDISNQINSGSTTKAATLSGATATSGVGNFYDQSMKFDGTNDYITWGSSTDWKFLSDGTTDYTIECWIRATSTYGYLGRGYILFNTAGSIGSGENGIGFWLNSSTIRFQIMVGGGGQNVIVHTYTLPADKWTHLALVNDGGDFGLFIDGVKVATNNGYSTWNSNTPSITLNTGRTTDNYYFNDGYMQDIRIYQSAKYTSNFIPASTDPDILPDTPSGVAGGSALTKITDGAVAFDGTNDKLVIAKEGFTTISSSDPFTIESFVYFNSLTDYSTIIASSTNSTGAGGFKFEIQNSLFKFTADSSGSGTFVNINSGPTLSTGRWYHLAASRDSSGNVRTFVDGQIAGTDSTNTGFSITWPYDVTLGTKSDDTEDFNGFISNAHIVSGTALYTANFTPPSAPISSVANTKLLCCKSNTSATAFDVSPGTITANGNAAATNFNPFTTDINAVRGQETGYATLNPLANYGVTLSNGNLTCTGGNDIPSTIGVKLGKWYAEVDVRYPDGPSDLMHIGICATGTRTFGMGADNGHILSNLDYIMIRSDAAGPFSASGRGGLASVSNVYNSGATYTIGDIISIELDIDNRYVKMYKNGTLRTHYTFTLASTFDGIYFYNRNNGSGVTSWNFGQKPFKFPPPEGFQPLTLANTPRPSIVRPDQYVGIVTYTGNGGTQTINYGFPMDLLWIKMRDGSGDNYLFDRVRGNNKSLYPSRSYIENDSSLSTYISQTFTKTGATVAQTPSGGNEVNYLGKNYVAWGWKAGGGSGAGGEFWKDDVQYASASAAGLTAGTITPTGASVNTKSGFSIITYTGTNADATISHGLGKIPQFIIAKSRNSSSWNWIVYHQALGVSDYLALESTQGSDTRFANIWGSGHTTSVFGVKTGYSNNPNGVNMVAYCWAEIPGFSKFGIYTGNGNANGSVVITGFRPKWIMLKETGNANPWFMFDTERSKINPTAHTLWANYNYVENDTNINPNTTYNNMDILSNGFKLRSSYSGTNRSGGTYIYAAFAEAPTFNLYGGQANAR